MSTLTLTAADGGSFTGYLAVPAAGQGPGLVVAQEIFGVNHVMRDLCDGFAAQGYVALCPDLFWRQQPGIDITDQTDAEWAQAFDLYKGFDEAAGVNDLQAALQALRGHSAVSGKVGGLGYCLGGKLAYLMATRTDVDCAVGYYGVGIEAALAEAGTIKAPLLLHIAEEDGFVSKEAQGEIRTALSGHPWVTMHSYPGVDHAFCRVGGAHFDQASADLANGRSAAFLERYLRG